MKTHATPLRPKPEHLAQIERILARIRPDDPNTPFSFIVPEIERRAVDLWLVERFITKSARVADVGCTPLLLQIALKENGYKVEGVDGTPEFYSQTIAAENLIVHRCNFETEPLPYPDASLDAVLFNEVLEHLRINLIFTLKEIRRVLKPDGILLLSTPNALSLSRLSHIVLERRLGVPIYEVYSDFERIGFAGHVREYSLREVCAFLSAIGFKIVSVSHKGRYVHPVYDAVLGLIPPLRPGLSVVAQA